MKKTNKKKLSEITDYDQHDTTTMINRTRPLEFIDLGLKLPKEAPSQVISIRLPTTLVNQLKALGSQQDVPYHALIKLFLAESLARMKNRLLA